MLSFGPGHHLGPRFVHAADFITMLANSWTPMFILEMMIFRVLIVFSIKYNKQIILLTTSVPFLYSLGISVRRKKSL